MSVSKVKNILKLFGFYYLSFFLVTMALFVLNAILFHFVMGIKFHPMNSYIQLLFSLPLVIAMMAIGFDAWEGKLEDNQ